MNTARMSPVPTWIPLNFETDLDHHLNTKKVRDLNFPIYLLIGALGRYCTRQVLLLTLLL